MKTLINLGLLTLWLPIVSVAQTKPIEVTLDASKTGAPISKYLYGQFLEHAGNLVNESVWAEMLEDRKFFYPITSKVQPEPPTPALGPRRRPPLRHWLPIGGDEFVTMDTSHPYSGDHTPLVQLEPTAPHGFAQSGIAIIKDRAYTGHIVLAGSPGAAVKVTLLWGDTPADRQTITIAAVSTVYRPYPLSFTARTDSEAARLEITGTGKGTLHVGAVSLMPANNIQGFRAEVITALKQLHSGVYRFPGGNFVSSYEWRDGIGDRDKRPTIYDPVWHTAQTNDVGTDEFMTLCHLLGVDPYITVNAGFGDAWSAKELVEYTNTTTTPMGRLRAANGHPLPYNVKLWGIGNEPWGDYQMGAMSPEQYALKHTLFAKAMRGVDPSITLIAGGAMPDVMEGANQSKRLGGKYIPDYLTPADWSGYLLSHDLDTIDMLSEHYYASGTQHTNIQLEKKVDITPPLSLTEWEREAATQVRAKYEHYQQYLKLIPALDQKRVPIAIDEWAYFGAPPNTFKTIPAYAWAFHEMFRHSDIFQLATFTFATAMMSENRTDAILNPTGLLFEMYRDHFGVIPVEVGGDSPQPKPAFPAGGDQPAVNPGSPTYPLDVSAALSEDRKTLTVAVINPSETEQSMHLSIDAAKLADHGLLWQMAAPLLATDTVGQKPEVEIAQRTLGALPGTIAVPPSSVTIYAYPLN